MDSSSMSGMDGMSGMEGMSMDMGSDGMFRSVNQKIARSYWYIVAALFMFALLLKSLEAIESWSRLVSILPTDRGLWSRATCIESNLTRFSKVNGLPEYFLYLTLRDLAI